MSPRYFGKQPPAAFAKETNLGQDVLEVPLPLLPKQLIMQSRAVLEYIFLKLKGVIMNTLSILKIK